MNKPRIRQTKIRVGAGFGQPRPLRVVWRCAVSSSIVVGYGNTPWEAYKEWASKWEYIKRHMQ